MKTSKAILIFPHQLFKTSEILELDHPVYLIEAFLFFKQYKFHKQKIAFHRASMKAYAAFLKEKGKSVTYIEATSERCDVRALLPQLIEEGIKEFHIIDPTDNWLEQRLRKAAEKASITWYNNPLFINSKADLEHFFKPSKKSFFQTTFYKQQRKKHDLLMVGKEPEGGKWSYDSENRKKYPKDKTPPSIKFPDSTAFHKEAKTYVNTHFKEHYGQLTDFSLYPIDFTTCEAWLDQFLEQRFHEFGVYEDAIVKEAHFLNHSLLSPLINVGLLKPQDVIDKAIDYAKTNHIPLNSTEGFVRQIVGWREFIRGIYELKGNEERTKNFWNFNRKIPDSFYKGTTGIPPIDDLIKKILKTGYAHHIERLMLLGNFMLLCEFDPDEVYQWFMELFVDAYDWVMVPNVYGMALFADGGLMATKPYISSSNYISKMSNYPKADWQPIWDGLFWRFIDKQRAFFLNNPRLGMLISTFDKMSPEKKEQHLDTAECFIDAL
ncbi:cryptochrome/photolyase family protein [Winogradskyella arenosi]|uniref:Deoxyribodipyrimidine photolyase-related protein n=1 Tax=Winogradskyella arenosi TaxID=533325 RepID=A0A368ZGX5_9FLAO|nr:cryptochrome/photolyase family protein [Winogradskyella arenosi]RCW91274.1 deoxyribodipyrimidine photolyase-related protein [Winogradskyella arenosi]